MRCANCLQTYLQKPVNQMCVIRISCLKRSPEFDNAQLQNLEQVTL